MDAKELPSRPSLEQYRKQAKDLLKTHKSGDPAALLRIRQHHPRVSKLPDAELRTARFVLADAQLVIAREHGVESWPKFAKHLEAMNRESSADAIWKSAENAVITGDAATLERLLRDHGSMLREQQPPASRAGGLTPDYSGGDARSIIARNHHFDNWAEFAEYVEALKRKNSTVAQFEAAVDAIVNGDAATLGRLFRKNPELIRARSTRQHQSTLLIYVGANGVEYFRQKTPKNAVAITEMLLKAGAEIDAEGKMYGGSTTLGLVATSVHPWQAGVQNALIQTLLDHSAAVDGGFGDTNVGGYTHGAVNGCLANGRGEAAEFLAEHGARLDLEAAAGVGRLDLVQRYFNEDGSLKANATEKQMRDGFGWACGYGRTRVVEFLLRRGMEVSAKLRQHGETGLHCAAVGGHVDTIKLLLERKAPLDVQDESFGGTPVSWALYGWYELPPGASRERYYRVVSMLVAAGASVKPEWMADEKVRADEGMLAALRASESEPRP